MWHDIIAVLQKEWVDLIRDRRALFAAFAYSLLGPVILSMTITQLADRTTSDPDRQVAVSGAAYAPTLIRMLQADGFEINETAPVRLLIPENYGERLNRNQPATLTISGDTTREPALVGALHVSLQNIAGTIRSQRTLARGIAPAVSRPFTVDLRDAASISPRGRAILSMLILFLILAPFLASTSVAIDTSSGERERRSLEPLLALPVSGAAIITGKWLAIALIGLAGTAVTITLAAWLVNDAPLAALGIRLHLDVGDLFAMLLYLAPLALLAAALQLLIAFSAPTFKEGQTYLTLFSFLPAVVGLVAVQTDAQRDSWFPILWEMDTLGRIAAGEPVAVASVVSALALYAALIAFAITAATVQLSRERILGNT